MQDELLSEAVVTFVWGDSHQSWPSSHPDAVRARFADQAGHLLSRIDALLKDLDHIQTANDLADFGHRIEEFLRTVHPELNHEARRALANKCTYSWR